MVEAVLMFGAVSPSDILFNATRQLTTKNTNTYQYFSNQSLTKHGLLFQAGLFNSFI